MESKVLPSLLLENFLDACPKPALVLKSDSQLLSGDSMTVCYANQAFREIIGDNFGGMDTSDNLTLLLHANCVRPTMPRLLKWVQGTLQNPNAAHSLRTSFEGNDVAETGFRKIVDIEWEAVVLQAYIVLTGKTTGTAAYFKEKPPFTPHPQRHSLQRLSSHSSVSTQPNSGEITSGFDTPIIKAISPGASEQSSVEQVISEPDNGTSFTTSYFTETFGDSKPTSPKGLDPWRHSEKILKTIAGGGIMGAMLREKNWGETKFGSMGKWPSSLVSMVSLLINSASPMALWYGKEHLVIYNDAYIPVAGNKHPTCFGESAAKYWGETWSKMEPVFTDVINGESVNAEESCVFVEREGYTEETYITWSYAPWRGEDGTVAGFLNHCFESTGRIIADRRLRTLGELDLCIASAVTMNDLGTSISKAFTFNAYDVPFALVYFCYSELSSSLPDAVGLERRSTSDSSLGNLSENIDRTTFTYTLQSTVGIPEGHVLAPRVVEIQPWQESEDDNSREKSFYVWPFKRMATEQTEINVKLATESLEGVRYHGWPDLPSSAVAVPIFGARETNGKELMTGMLIMGLNPRRKFDDDYRSWIRMCSRHIAAAMSARKSGAEATQRTEELAVLNRSRTAFFQSVSHELRTPLALILGPLEECIDDPHLSHPHRNRLNLIRRNAQRLLRLVNSLLDFSRLEAGKMSALFKETDLQRYTTDLASLFRSAIEKGGVKYEVVMDGRDRSVWVDRDMWEKIVFNIIGNAFKFTLSGHIHVSCRLSSSERHMVFSVRDTGIGIPAHEVPHIFENFHRAHNQNGRSYEGTGMGLALTQALVNLHGGKMEVESTFGHGTTFTVYIPVGNSHLPPNQVSTESNIEDNVRQYGKSIVDEAESWGAPDAQPDIPVDEIITESASSSESSNDVLLSSILIPPSTRGSKVLVADDNEDMRRFVKGVLLQFYQVLEAPNGQIALAIAIEQEPALILSDIMMPGLDGFGLLKVIRSSPQTRSIPFVLLSAYAGEKARVDGLLAGADDYLVKPFSPKELIARVHTLIDNARVRVELDKRVREVSKGLIESEERFRILSVMSPVGIARVNMLGQVIYGNPRWMEMSGRGADEELQSLVDLVHPDDREIMDELLKDAIENTKKAAFELRWGAHDRFLWIMGELVPEIVDEEHRGYIGVLTDVTERRHSELARLEAVEEARAHQELAIDIICHELRNPLNGIYHNGEIVYENILKIRDKILLAREDLARSPIPSSLIDLLQLFDDLEYELACNLEAMGALNQCARHQNRIAEDVLQLGKLSMNLTSLKEMPFDPVIEMKDCIRTFERKASAKKIELKFSIGKGYESLQVGWVSGDSVRFSQVLLNLLSNAVRFTEKAPIRTIQITLDASVEEPNLSPLVINDHAPEIKTSSDDLSRSTTDSIFLISAVIDSGVGLTKEEQNKLFQKLAQSSPKTHIEYEGSGLGLVISKALVEAQGGRLTLESEKYKGTKLTFYICVKRADPPVEIPTSGLVKSSSFEATLTARREPSVPLPDSNLNVLIVEDNLINQKVLARQLQLTGFRTAVANHGMECLEILKENSSFDIILMDIEMPEMDGITAVSEIRRLEGEGKLTPTPIIAVTGNARQEHIERAFSVGIDYFIAKPYEKKELIDKIFELTKRGHT